jgi:transcriptional regulator with XRE-family HTH domain
MKAIDKIDRLIKDRGTTAAALAAAIGIPVDRIYKWRQLNEGQPDNEVLVKIAEYFHVPEVYLLNPEITEIPGPALTAAQLAGIEMIAALDLEKSEVLRRLSGPLNHPPVAKPIADHRGQDGTKPVLGMGAQGKNRSTR